MPVKCGTEFDQMTPMYRNRSTSNVKGQGHSQRDKVFWSPNYCFLFWETGVADPSGAVRILSEAVK